MPIWLTTPSIGVKLDNCRRCYTGVPRVVDPHAAGRRASESRVRENRMHGLMRGSRGGPLDLAFGGIGSKPNLFSTLGATLQEAQALKANETLLRGVTNLLQLFQWAPVLCVV